MLELGHAQTINFGSIPLRTGMFSAFHYCTNKSMVPERTLINLHAPRDISFPLSKLRVGSVHHWYHPPCGWFAYWKNQIGPAVGLMSRVKGLPTHPFFTVCLFSVICTVLQVLFWCARSRVQQRAPGCPSKRPVIHVSWEGLPSLIDTPFCVDSQAIGHCLCPKSIKGYSI